jgi:hypothetical protein
MEVRAKKSARLGAHNGSEKSETSYVYLIIHSSLINTKFKFVGLNFEKFFGVIRNSNLTLSPPNYSNSQTR